MIDPTKTLAVCEAATEGPWAFHVDTFRGATAKHERIGSKVINEDVGVAWNGLNATFITQARTELPALAKFARDVLALHGPITGDSRLCVECGNVRPCPTVELAAKYGIEVAG